MQEHYSWWGSIRKLSKTEIRKMKENMQKTPLIQEKSDRYHDKEVLEADLLLESVEIQSSSKESHHKPLTPKKIWFFQKLKAYLFW